MRNRPVLSAVLASFLGAGTAAAQSPCTGCPPTGGHLGTDNRVPVPAGSSSLFAPPGESTATTPSREVLERLNLRNEWNAYIPMDSRADGMGLVQVVDGGQVFVQTRAGRLIALDSTTGATQWSFRFPKSYANLFPVGMTDQFVFAVSVNTLYCFARYTGLLEFEYDLPGLSLSGAGGPAAGPVADDQNVYLVLGSTRVAAYRYPKPLTAPAKAEIVIGPNGLPVPPAGKEFGLAEQVASRYAGTANVRISSDPNPFQRTEIQNRYEYSGSGLGAMQKTPSINSLSRITPPYSLARGVTTPSIAVLNSLRQPYTLSPNHLKYNQATPSITLMPPTVAAAMVNANLRPRRSEPVALWPAVGPGRAIYEPIQTATQLWFTTEGPLAYALTKADGASKGKLELSSSIVAPAAGPVVGAGDIEIGFFSQADGTVTALDLPGGTLKNPKIEWRSNVGGYLNQKPFPSTNGVYVSGENSGIARLDLKYGDVTWRTEPGADKLLAVNDEFAYVRDNRGSLRIYPRTVPNNPAAPVARSVAQLDLPAFNVSVTNEFTDRILIGADSGLLICLRDASPKYTQPIRTAPLPPKPPAQEKKDGMPAAEKADEAK